MEERITKEELKKELNRIMGESQSKLHDHYDSVREKVMDQKEKADKYVSENPEKSVAAGLGIGFLVGIIVAWIFSRRG